MDRPPFDKEKAKLFLKTAIESSAKVLIPIVLNEGVNVLTLDKTCKIFT